MYQLWVIVQIILNISIILWIFDWMIENGLLKEVSDFVREMRRRLE